MKRPLALLIAALLGISALVTGCKTTTKDSTFEIKDGNFYFDGEKTMIHSGEIHFSRIPREYWRDRLRMLRSMGLNTIATYVFWNYHESAPGVWDFSGDKDLHEFIRTAGEEGLRVILRPGPYSCGEWEYGGIPWWMQNIEGLKVREDNEVFLEYTGKYFNKLYEEVHDLQVTCGGPLILVQCENEFGSYVDQRKDIPLEQHKIYVAKITSQIREAGFDVPLFTSDGDWLFEGGAVEGILPTANGEYDPDNLKVKVNAYNNNEGPYMVAEFYPGWLDHWGEPFIKVSPEWVAAQTETFLKNDVSFNFYMSFGGTNFGFWSGANYDDKHDIQPDITSYDYDALLTEAGHPTEKFFLVRELLRKYDGGEIPEVPENVPVIEIPEISFSDAVDVISYASTLPATTAESPLTFEKMNQGYGYMLYTRKFETACDGLLEIPGLRDFATVYVDGARVGVLSRQSNTYSTEISIPEGATLRILVENLGRINYGAGIADNNKGIIGDVLIAGEAVKGGWEMRGLPLEAQPKLGEIASEFHNTVSEGATFYSGSFKLGKTGDTYLDMSGFGKGIVFINGHNLGRYWNIGPQQTLYVPGCWLKKGRNEIVVFEQLGDKEYSGVKGVTEPVLYSCGVLLDK